MITSSANGKVKQIMNLTKKAKARKESGLFVAEGLRMFKEIPRDRIDSLFVSESFLKNPEGRKVIGSMNYEEVADDVFKTMSDTATPQGVLALVKQYAYTIDDILDGAPYDSRHHSGSGEFRNHPARRRGSGHYRGGHERHHSRHL